MDSVEILERYNQIEYRSTTTDREWYKLKDYYPFAFPVEGDDEAVVLDSGGEEGGDFGHFKITDGKLLRKDIASHEWIVVTDVRVVAGATPANPRRKPGIVAVGEPFVIDRSKKEEGL